MANNSKIERQTLQKDDLMNRIQFTSRFKYFVTFQREIESASFSRIWKDEGQLQEFVKLKHACCLAHDWERSGLLEENPQSGCSDICASLKGPL